MSRRALVLACLFACLWLAACGHHAGAPVTPVTQPPDASPAPVPAVDAAPAMDAQLPLAEDPGALAAGVVAVYEDVATSVSAGDCAAMATAVGELRAKHALTLDALHKADAAGRDAAIATALEPYRDRIRASLDTIEAKTAPCAKDATLEHAIDALFGG